MLGGLGVELVIAQTAGESNAGLSAAADSKCEHFKCDNVYLMDCNVVFTLSISAIAMMPSAV